MRTWARAAIAALLSLAFAAVLQVDGLSSSAVTLVSNGGQLLAAVCASAACVVASTRTEGRRRLAWRWLSAGTGCWAAGQAVWSFYEAVLRQDAPFPSLADVGFLAFPLVAGVGLVIWAGAQGHKALARGRDVLDGAIIAVSLLVLSWVTVMDPVVATSGGFDFSVALSLAYPLGDVVLGTLVLIAVFRSDSERTTLTLLALGLGGFALADSLFVYLTSSGTYSSADLVSSSGWVFGFLIVAVAALSAVRAARPDTVSGRDRSSWGWLALPYVPLAGAGIALFEDLRRSHGHALSDLLLSVVLVVLVLTRQFLAMFDNQRLLQALAEAGGQLEHQAMHDALTGLPNRMLFAKRLDRALLAPTSSVSVLFCDLDNFKPVNDELGHAAGDLLLKTVADRLLACVRERDTVARLGGDEFAVLLVDCPDAREVADRIVASMDVETVVMGQPVRTSISVGVAHHEATVRPAPAAKHRFAETAPRHRDRSLPAERLEVAAGEAFAEREATAALLIRLADTAMYAAKSAGKGRAAVLDADPVRSSRRSSVAT